MVLYSRGTCGSISFLPVNRDIELVGQAMRALNEYTRVPVLKVDRSRGDYEPYLGGTVSPANLVRMAFKEGGLCHR